MVAVSKNLETAERFQPCLALYMIVAWRVMYALMMGRACPDASCELIFSEDEWKDENKTKDLCITMRAPAWERAALEALPPDPDSLRTTTSG